MHPSEVNILGLWYTDTIDLFKSKFSPTAIYVVVADTHVGAANALMIPKFELLDGSTILGNADHITIYNCWETFWKTVSRWKYSKVFFLGDLPSATSHKLFNNSSLDVIDLDNQKEMLYQLLKGPCDGVETHFISGTSTMHDSIDTKVHLDLSKRLGGKFHFSGEIREKVGENGIKMSHQARLGALFPNGTMEREAIFQGFGILTGKVTDDRNIIGAHWHMFEEVNRNGIVITNIPGWQKYYPIKGRTAFKAIRVPPVGGLVLLCNEKGVLTIPYVFGLPLDEDL